MIPKNVVTWLVESEDPSVRYRTLMELLGRSITDFDVQECRNQITASLPVKTLLDKMHPDGYWLQKNPRTGNAFGDDVAYGAYGTTHYCLSYLAELGMDRSHPQITKAAERYLLLQKMDGDFYGHFSCLLGYNIRTFTMLGYKDDPRVKRSIDLLLNTERLDGGYLCDLHEGKYKTKSAKSCIRESVKALLAFSCFPEYWNHDRIKQLVYYFLFRNGIFKSTKLTELVNKDMELSSFPITWRANVIELLLALGRMGYGKDRRLERAWKLLDFKRDTKGRYRLDWTPRQSPWRIGKRNTSNKWVTFYAYLAHKCR